MVLEYLQPVFVLSVLFGGTTILSNVFLSHRFKNKVVNAGKLDINPELMQSFFAKKETNELETLKWGLIVLFGGIGLIVIHFLNFDINSALPWGVEMTAISAGFLTYFFTARAIKKQ